ncbi:MAG: PAS domain-containing protein [Opitutaceae bacterium]|nr:PAS domain-containing protein [Opitutaceae bacterium]
MATTEAAHALTLNYRIDADDRIIAVNDAWGEFAEANDGGEVVADKVIGRSLWDFVSGEGIAELYWQMIRRARAGHPVEFTYRCDAPEWRRLFRMTVRAHEHGVVEFRSVLEWEEPRPKVQLLDCHQTRDARWTRVCSWCQQVAVADEVWLPVEEAVARLDLLAAETMPQLTHGICPACRDGMMRKLQPA